MKVWKKAHFLKKDKNIDIVCKSYLNYIYGSGPISAIKQKYDISEKDINVLNQYTANRIAGLLVLYLAKDKKRLNDIVLKYQINEQLVEDIIPEIEGYVEK